jgi:3',5'-cyclic AMP phosphodiesterase CpdA
MIRRLGLPAAVLAGVTFAGAAQAARLGLDFHGGAWTMKAPDAVQVWANSPQSSIELDNQSPANFQTMNVTWQNLVVGGYLATPEGVVIGSARDRNDLTTPLTVPPRERQSWGLNSNINGPYRFAVIGDTENAETGARTFGALSRRMAAQKVLFAIHLGDAVTPGNVSQLQVFRRQLTSFPFPAYVVPGHDDLVKDGAKTWKRLFGDVPLSFRIDRDRFVMLNNAHGTLTPRQRVWLYETLNKATDEKARHVFVFMHRPLVDLRPGLNKGMIDVKEVRWLLGLFQQHHVHTAFAGHVHMYGQERRKDVNYVTTGGGGDKLVVPENRGGFHHFVQVDVNGDKVGVTTVRQ